MYGITVLYHERELYDLPDGSIISWVRIPDDESSRVVAFVHFEDIPLGNTGACERCTWISPGVYAPVSVREAELHWPIDVIKYGDQEHLTPIVGTLETGGTWAREKALECASRLYGGDTVLASLDELFSTAEAFEKWLNR